MLSEIRGSHDRGCENCCVLGCNSIYNLKPFEGVEVGVITTVSKNCRYSDICHNDAEVGVSQLQRILWASADTTVPHPSAHCHLNVRPLRLPLMIQRHEHRMAISVCCKHE